MSRRGARAAALALIAGTAMACSAMGCAAILGVDEERDSVAEFLCKCPALSGDEHCKSRIEDGLQGATEAVRAEWLKKFAELACDSQCTNAVSCIRTLPTCKATGFPCDDDNDCCGGEKCASDIGSCKK